MVVALMTLTGFLVRNGMDNDQEIEIRVLSLIGATLCTFASIIMTSKGIG